MIEHALSVYSQLNAILPLHFSGMNIAYITLSILNIIALIMNNIKLNHLTSLILAILSLGMQINAEPIDFGIQYSLNIYLK